MTVVRFQHTGRVCDNTATSHQMIAVSAAGAQRWLVQLSMLSPGAAFR